MACDFCERGKPMIKYHPDRNAKHYGLWGHVAGEPLGVYVEARIKRAPDGLGGYELGVLAVCGEEASDVGVPVNFCPMCGRDLRKEG